MLLPKVRKLPKPQPLSPADTARGRVRYRPAGRAALEHEGARLESKVRAGDGKQVLLCF